MPEKAQSKPQNTPAVDLRSGSITLPILKVLKADLKAVHQQLDDKISKAPEFFRNTPVIVDIGDMPEDQKRKLDFPALLKCLHDLTLAPVGMRGGNPDQQKAAHDQKLAVLAEVKTETGSAAQKSEPARKRVPPPRPMTSQTRVINQPVRSGQLVYAAGGDLIVLAPVSPGAEIMADGNIHVYAPLKGRALAGVQGDTSARIFCSDLQAQLVAISGHYRTSENEDNLLQGKMVQIYLQDDALMIDQL